MVANPVWCRAIPGWGRQVEFNQFERLFALLTNPLRRERAVVVVLASYAALWALYGVLAKASQDIHSDSAELVVWSRVPALGNPKHPPLAAWVVSAWFAAFPASDWAYYLLAILYMSVGLWLTWRLFAEFLDAQKCVVALALLTFVPFYNFHALKFDHNVVLIPLWAATTFCFIRAFRTRGALWSALAGITAAAAMLGKYWSIFLLAGLALAAILDSRGASYFRSAAPWITMIAGLLVLAPHLQWLLANDFAPFSYALGVHELGFSAAMAGVAGYIAGAVGYVSLPVLIALAAARPSRAAIMDTLKPAEPDRRFAAVAFCSTLLLPVPVALMAGVKLNSMWSMSGWALLPVVLLSSRLIALTRPAVLGIVSAAVLLPMVMIVAAPAVAIAIHRAGLSGAAAHGRLLADRMLEEWKHATDKPLRLIGGDLDLVNVTAFYLADRPLTFPVEHHQYAKVDAALIARDGIALVCHMHPDPDNTCVH